MARDMELRIRFSKTELALVREAAKKEKLELSTWARVVLLKKTEEGKP